MSNILSATDDDIAKIKELGAPTQYVFTGAPTIVGPLIARIDLEVAGRKADAERIKGLQAWIEPKLVSYSTSFQHGTDHYECRGCGATWRDNDLIQHKPDCLLWKGPTE